MKSIKPEGIQSKVLYLKGEGHTVVLGTAGSGKTTIAVLRARYLAEIDINDKVLLVTFNRALVAYFNTISQINHRNIHVRNYHHFARGYLKARGRKTDYCIVSDSDVKMNYIGKALEVVKARHSRQSTLSRPLEDFYEEISWIQKMGISSLDMYYDIERIGRQDSYIKRENRKYFFEVYEEYYKIRSADDYLYDWDDIASYVLAELVNDNTPRMYKHIVVDEGQDFSPVMLRSLVKRAPKNLCKSE